MGKKKPARKNRYKKRAKKKQRRMAGRLAAGFKLISLIVILLAVSALFVVGYAAVTQTNYFSTHAIEIQGQVRLSENEILEQAGIKHGDNILAINLRLVRKRLLAHPWISKARVAREIPETIQIVISEHKPLAVVDLERKFLINRQGRIFKENGRKDPKGLPLVTGIAYADVSLGDDDLTPVMQTVVQVLRMSQKKESIIPYVEIRKLHMDAQMGVTLNVWKQERKIKLGVSRFEYKFQKLKKLMPYLKYNDNWKGFHAIDVNNPDRIVVQL
ncbi:MAG: FtsQ-type POTRA domain-containing protein [Desulfobacteraceae bacterium]